MLASQMMSLQLVLCGGHDQSKKKQKRKNLVSQWNGIVMRKGHLDQVGVSWECADLGLYTLQLKIRTAVCEKHHTLKFDDTATVSLLNWSRC